MSWLSVFWKKESTQVILKSALAILKVFMGKVANDAWKMVTDAVSRAEDMPLTGQQKAKYVLDDLKSQLPGIKDHLANLMLELAVAWLKEGLIKK